MSDRNRGEGPSCGLRPGGFIKSLQHLWWPLERKPRLGEGLDDLFETGYLVIEGDDCHVGELIDFHFLCLDNVCEGPTDPVPGEGSLAVGQQELDDPFLGHGG